MSEKLYTDSRELFFNIEIEKTILGNIINEPKLIYKLNEFPESVFYSTVNAEIFGILRYIMNDKGNIDIVLIGDYLMKYKPSNITITYITEMIEMGFSSVNFNAYRDIIIDLHQKRQIRQAIKNIDYTKEADEVKSELLTKMNDLYVIQEEEKISDVVLNTVDTILSGKVEKGVMTGYSQLDNNLLGFNKGELITISARSGVGKTTFAVNMFTYQVFRGYKAHYFSLEMPKEVLIKKMLSVQGRIENKHLRMNNASEIDVEQIVSLSNALASKNFNIYDNNSNLEFIESRIREEKIKNNCDIIYVDLINRVKTKKKSGSRAEEIGLITRALKQLALELKIPIVILAQINRGAEQRADKRPLLSDLKESGSIEEDSDVVVSLYRNLVVCDKNYQGDLDYYSDDPDRNPERIEVALIKSRYTGNAVLSMLYEGEYGIIREKLL